MIQIKNLSKTYSSPEGQVEALKNINVQVATGEIFGIIGSSGAGKSSLIRCINLLERPTEGNIFVHGIDMITLRPRELRQARKKIGMIFQHFNLLETATVYENVAVALELSKVPQTQIKNKVHNLLEIVGLVDKANNYPAQLSGGQKQRVAIARALANDVEVLLCDEATSALDPQTTEAILDLLLDINHRFKITILLITHEMNVIRKICDRVAVLEDGKIIEEDSIVNIFTKPQQPTTKKFIKSIIEEDLPEKIINQLQQRNANFKIVRLTFLGCSAAQPILAQIAKELPLSPNILGGNIIQVKEETLGRLIVELEGQPRDIQQAIEMLENVGVLTEVLEYGGTN